MGVLQAVFLFLRALLLRRAAAAFENLALRQQVAVLNHSVKRPKLRPRDVEPPSLGEVGSIPQAGGLHHRYTRRAA